MVGLTVPDATYSVVLTTGNTSEPFISPITSTAPLDFSLGGLLVGSGSGILAQATIDPQASVLLGDGCDSSIRTNTHSLVNRERNIWCDCKRSDSKRFELLLFDRRASQCQCAADNIF